MYIVYFFFILLKNEKFIFKKTNNIRISPKRSMVETNYRLIYLNIRKFLDQFAFINKIFNYICYLLIFLNLNIFLNLFYAFYINDFSIFGIMENYQNKSKDSLLNKLQLKNSNIGMLEKTLNFFENMLKVRFHGTTIFFNTLENGRKLFFQYSYEQKNILHFSINGQNIKIHSSFLDNLDSKPMPSMSLMPSDSPKQDISDEELKLIQKFIKLSNQESEKITELFKLKEQIRMILSNYNKFGDTFTYYLEKTKEALEKIQSILKLTVKHNKVDTLITNENLIQLITNEKNLKEVASFLIFVLITNTDAEKIPYEFKYNDFYESFEECYSLYVINLLRDYFKDHNDLSQVCTNINIRYDDKNLLGYIKQNGFFMMSFTFWIIMFVYNKIIYQIIDKQIGLNIFVALKNREIKKNLNPDVKSIIKSIQKTYLGQDETLKKVLSSIMNSIELQSYGKVLLQGTSGVGKTMLSELSALHLNIVFNILKGSDFSVLTDDNTTRFFNALYIDDIYGVFCIDEFEKMDKYYQQIFLKLLETREAEIKINGEIFKITLFNKYFIFTTNAGCELSNENEILEILKKILGKALMSRIGRNSICYLKEFDVKKFNQEDLIVIFKEEFNKIMQILNIEELEVDSSFLNYSYDIDLGLRAWKYEILEEINEKIIKFKNSKKVKIRYVNNKFILSN